MRITRIRLTDFQRHEHLEIEPAAGLTVIRGPNEAGKSTIQRAIELALFRKPDSSRKDVVSSRRWRADGPPVVELDFEVDGLAGSLIKRFDGQKAEGKLSHGETSTSDLTLIQQRISDLMGIPTEAFFRSTASVGHAELAEVGSDEPIIQDRLQKAISGADRGTAKAKKKLETAIHRYRTEGQKNPGLLKVIGEEITRLEGELAVGEQALGQLEMDRATWVEAHERRESLDAQLTRQQADLAEARRAEQLAQRRDAAQDRYERLRRAAELVARGNELRRGMPTDIPLSSLRSAVARVSSLSLALAELEAELSIDTSMPPAAEARLPQPLRWLALAGGLVVLAVLAWFALGGLVGALALLVLSIGVLAALVQTGRTALRRRQVALARDMAEHAMAHREGLDRQHQEEFRRTRRELESQLASLGAADIEQAQQMLAAVETRTEELAHIEGELRGLSVEERGLSRLEAARDQAANEAEQARHALSGMGKLAEDPVSARQAAEELVKRTLPARDAARSEEDQAQGRVDANPVDADVVAGLAERLAAARERQAELEVRALVYQATLQAIEAAERATLKTAARYLEERMGPTISRITAGRYSEVQVDEKNLAFKVRAPETGELVDVESISRGTADQLFLAARLGLVRLVTMDRRPPLILDDPFVTFDSSRGERALRLVREVAAEQGFQVLYLTCTDRFDTLADELVVLDAPSDEALERPTMAWPSTDAARGSGIAGARGADDSTGARGARDTDAAAQAGPWGSAPAEARPRDERDTGVVDPFRLGGSGGSGGRGGGSGGRGGGSGTGGAGSSGDRSGSGDGEAAG